MKFAMKEIGRLDLSDLKEIRPGFKKRAKGG